MIVTSERLSQVIFLSKETPIVSIGLRTDFLIGWNRLFLQSKGKAELLLNQFKSVFTKPTNNDLPSGAVAIIRQSDSQTVRRSDSPIVRQML